MTIQTVNVVAQYFPVVRFLYYASCTRSGIIQNPKFYHSNESKMKALFSICKMKVVAQSLTDSPYITKIKIPVC